MFFISKSFADAEIGYNHLEQAALALWVATKKLCSYFQAHPIVLLTNLPFLSTIHKHDLSGRMARWEIELSEFGIQYKSRLAKKGQVIADFLVEIPQPRMNLGSLVWWSLNVDGVSRKTRAGISLQLKYPTREKIEQVVHLGLNAFNNESEYEAILAGIELATVVSTDRLLIQSDSQLVVGQVNADYESRDPRMPKYVSLVKRLGIFSAWKLKHIPKDCNEKADALAAVAASFPITDTVFLPIYYQPDSSLITTRVSQVDETSPSWTDPIVQCINTGELPNERGKAHKIQIQSARFSLINGQLFKRSLDGSCLKCLTTK